VSDQHVELATHGPSRTPKQVDPVSAPGPKAHEQCAGEPMEGTRRVRVWGNAGKVDVRGDGCRLAGVVAGIGVERRVVAGGRRQGGTQERGGKRSIIPVVRIYPRGGVELPELAFHVSGVDSVDTVGSLKERRGWGWAVIHPGLGSEIIGLLPTPQLLPRC